MDPLFVAPLRLVFCAEFWKGWATCGGWLNTCWSGEACGNWPPVVGLGMVLAEGTPWAVYSAAQCEESSYCRLDRDCCCLQCMAWVHPEKAVAAGLGT